MLKFDSRYYAPYIAQMRNFLGYPVAHFKEQFKDLAKDIKGSRKSLNSPELLQELETHVNAKAARVEAKDTTVIERYSLAKDYADMSDSDVARALAVSRQAVDTWKKTTKIPDQKIEALSGLLKVPLAWLRDANTAALPANSHLGARVGDERAKWQEALFGMTQAIIAELPDEADEQFIQAQIEYSVFNRPEMASAARKAGGRWQLASGGLFFSPWQPLPPGKKKRSAWRMEVEQIIDEELGRNKTTRDAWLAVKSKCEKIGLGENEYPKYISLLKRQEKEQIHAEKFGVDLNPLIAQALEKYPMTL